MSMGEHLVPVLFITANVGSVFENVSYVPDTTDVICCSLIPLMLSMSCLPLDMMHEDSPRHLPY